MKYKPLVKSHVCLTFVSRLSHDRITLSCCWRRFDCNTASLHQAMRSIVYVSLFVACWFAAFGAFRSSLLFRLLDVVPWQVRFVVDRLSCFLIVHIQASGISIPLSLLMLLGWSLIWIALRVYQWGSWSINKFNFFPNRKMPRFASLLRYRGGLRTCKPYISVVFFHHIIHS